MEFHCSDPTATVRAANVRATLDAFRLIPSVGAKLIQRHSLHLDDLRPDRTVPVQSWLNALAEIHGTVGREIVRSVGSAIIENAVFPDSFDSVESILLALDHIYYLNHSGDVGHYLTRKRDDGAIEVGCETPYPRAFEQGLVEGISRNPRGAKRRRYWVDYVDGGPLTNRTCTLIVQSAPR